MAFHINHISKEGKFILVMKEFFVYVNHQKLRITKQPELVDLSPMLTIDEINLG